MIGLQDLLNVHNLILANEAEGEILQKRLRKIFLSDKAHKEKAHLLLQSPPPIPIWTLLLRRDVGRYGSRPLNMIGINTDTLKIAE